MRLLRLFPPAGLWSRAYRWRISSAGLPAWAPGIMPALGLIPFLWFQRSKTYQPGDMGLTPTFVLIFPALMLLVFTWQYRWRRLGYESLRPAGRPAFFREMALALAIDLLYGWVLACLSLLAVIAVFSPDNLRDPALIWPIVLSPFLELFIYSMSVWLMTFRRPGFLIGLSIGTALLIMWLLAQLTLPYPDITNRPRSIRAIIALGILTLPILGVAYRRWLVTDLD